MNAIKYVPLAYGVLGLRSGLFVSKGVIDELEHFQESGDSIDTAAVALGMTTGFALGVILWPAIECLRLRSSALL
jgi:hypothetical protein